MIYIDENSTTVIFPRVAISNPNEVTFTNQTTKETFGVGVEDKTNNRNYYSFDIGSIIMKFTNGQYDYAIKDNGKVIGTGIIQYGDYIVNNDKYNADIDIIQYDRE